MVIVVSFAVILFEGLLVIDGIIVYFDLLVHIIFSILFVTFILLVGGAFAVVIFIAFLFPSIVVLVIFFL